MATIEHSALSRTELQMICCQSIIQAFDQIEQRRNDVQTNNKYRLVTLDVWWKLLMRETEIALILLFTECDKNRIGVGSVVGGVSEVAKTPRTSQIPDW